MAVITFNKLMCLRNNKTGQIAYMAHPTDMAMLCPEDISGGFKFDESAKLPLMKDHKFHTITGYRKGDDWFMMEREFARLS